MLTDAKATKLVAATLLALAAACGSGQQPGTIRRGTSIQASTGLAVENGLTSFTITESCLTLDAATTSTASITAAPPCDPTVDPTCSAPTCDPTVDPTCSAPTCDPTVDPTCSPSTSSGACDPTIDPNCATVAAACDPTVDPTCSTTTTCDPTIDPTCATDASTGTITTAVCGDLMNGLPPNMLGLKGLNPNALHSEQFDKWFSADPSAAGMLMKYLVRCAMPAEDVLTYVDSDGNSWSWAGGFAFAPVWASGHAIPEAEQELVSGCVAAHVNKYGLHVPISVLGNHADGTPVPYTADELSTFSVTEGCFFGNLFKNDNLYSADDRTMSMTDAESSLRACALPDRDGTGATSNCAPLTYAGRCEDICTKDPSGLYYVACQIGRRVFRPVTTRMMPSFNYTCGDGVCQPTEHCGTGSSFNNCGLDCGPCN